MFLKRNNMTELGEYLAKKPISKAAISRRTGISTSRLNQLTLNASTKLRANEVYLIALAIEVDPCEVLKAVCGGLKLEK
jgi:lambda repressor-like predicted transcriptional regulator